MKVSFQDNAVLLVQNTQQSKGERHVIYRKANHQGHIGSGWSNYERNGADCAWRFPVAHLLYSVRVWCADGGSKYVVWYFRGVAALPGHGHCVRGTLKALSRSGIFLFLRRTSISE